MKNFIVLFLVFALAVSASADTTWTGAVSSDWDDTGNWSAGVPDGADLVDLKGAGTAPVIAGTAATGGINIQWGYLTINAGADLSVGSATGKDVTVGNYGNGEITMNGGNMAITDDLKLSKGAGASGVVYLNGGTITAAELVMVDNGATAALVDITGGILEVDQDITAMVQGYVDSGYLTAYGNASYNPLDASHILIETFTGDLAVPAGGTGTRTRITAIPEPATMVLLGLGGLALIRRKRS